MQFLYVGGISMVVAGGAALIHSLLTTIYVLAVTSPGENSVLTGISAVQRKIEHQGSAAYLWDLAPMLLLSYACCWGAYLAVRAWGGSRLRLVALCATVAMLFAFIHRFFQRIVMTDGLSGLERVSSGLEGLVLSIQAFGMGSVVLQVIGHSVFFLATALLAVLLAQRPRNGGRVVGREESPAKSDGY
jgi:hypothetical protein